LFDLKDADRLAAQHHAWKGFGIMDIRTSSGSPEV
jgi:hypothetical protein